MTINPKLLEEILKHSGLEKSRIYEIIGIQGKKFLISNEIAAYYYANSIGIDIRQYTQDESILDKIRNLSISKTTIKLNPQTQIQKTKEKLPVTTYPFLEIKDINNCEQNSEMYSRFYFFENSIRKMVSKILEKEYGLSWWDYYVKKYISSIDSNVMARKADEQNTPWHSGRGLHNIYYTNMDDLRQIIENNRNKLFSKYFHGKKNLKIFIGWIFEIEHSRNILAHNNPLSKKDGRRIIQITDDYFKFSKNIEI